jgi:hypothetical protein
MISAPRAQGQPETDVMLGSTLACSIPDGVGPDWSRQSAALTPAHVWSLVRHFKTAGPSDIFVPTESTAALAILAWVAAA